MEVNEVVQTFLEESSDLLQQLEEILLGLEESGEDDPESINSLFRAAHTIKGSAGMCDFKQVMSFTHLVENVLDQRRNEGRGLDAGLIELLLTCTDQIGQLIQLELGQVDIELESVQQTSTELQQRLQAYLQSEETPVVQEGSAANHPLGDWYLSIRFGADVFRCGHEPSAFLYHLASVGEITHITTLYDAMPAAAEMDAESCYLDVEITLRSAADRATIAGVFEFVQDSCTLYILPPESHVDRYIKHIEQMPEGTRRLGEMLIHAGLLTRNELESALQHQRGLRAQQQEHRLIGEVLVAQQSVHEPVLKAALEKQRENEAQLVQRSVIKVPTDKLDELVNLVGEMVIVQARLQQAAKQYDDPGLEAVAEDLERLTTELRNNTFNIRMVAIGTTFNRYRRLVRDLAHKLHKDILLETEGADTELDKTVIDQLGDPLIHLIRNSLDHGIEDPELREAAGKARQGRVRLAAHQSDSTVMISISDDGGGIDPQQIRARAIELGLMSATAEKTESELLDLIFEPGFSTAEQISDVSGRGVGLDVVKRSIEALHGTVDISSQLGLGSTITITLPLTLAIIEGLLVQVANDYFVIPLSLVEQCIELSREAVAHSHGEQVIDLRDEPVPYVSLRDWFGEQKSDREIEQVVIVQLEDGPFGLVVDQVIGQHQTVIKRLGRLYQGLAGLAGATILGDGSVALILDVNKLYQSMSHDAEIQRHQR